MLLVDNPILKLIESEIPEFIDTEEIPHAYRLRGKWLRGVSTVAAAESKVWLAPWKIKLVCQSIKDQLDKDFFHSAVEDLLRGSITDDSKSTIDAIIKKAKKAPDALKDKGAEAGTEFHDAIESVIKGDTSFAIKDELIPMVKPFYEWQKANIKQWLYIEQPVGDYDMGCAGTFDGLGVKHDGSLVLADWKTNDTFPDDAFGKTAGYLGMVMKHGEIFNSTPMLDENFPHERKNGRSLWDDEFIENCPIDRVILWLPKNPDVCKHLPNGYLAVRSPFTFAQDWAKFVAMNEIAKYQKDLKDAPKPWVFDKKAPVDNDVPLHPPTKTKTKEKQ